MNTESAGHIAEAYHKWYYDTEVWQRLTFLGVPCQKSVSDLWNYQEILTELRPRLLVEFGTYAGASALYFSHILSAIRKKSRVLTVDVTNEAVHPRARADRRIEFLVADSKSEEVRDRIRALRRKHRGPIFAILDSAHEKEHVLGELRSLEEVLQPGDYVVVEDTNINGHPVLPGWGEGPMEALDAFEREFPDAFEHDTEREEKFGFTFAPRGFLRWR